MDIGSLTAELEAALVREIQAEYHRLNASYFKRALRPPLLLLSEATTRLGRYDLGSRTLELSRALALEHPWSTLLEVLKHEMAHQYVLEHLGIVDEPPHGPTFRDVCRRMGIDHAAAGMPTTPEARTEDEERTLSRIAKLLALAESPSKHEAEAAMNAAQRLMLKYNLDATAARAKGAERAFAFRTLGRPSGRVTESERTLAAILGDHFFVEVIWVPAYRPHDGKRGSVLEISGTPANLEMAAYVHSFLSHAADRLWTVHKRAHQLRGDKDRRTFLAGVMAGFHAKLQSERKTQAKEGLVWVGDPELKTYYRRRHPNVVTVRYGGSARNDAHAHGREAGQKLVLHRPVGSGPSGGGPKLLGR
jgi:predicted SprT family Zn-dependent metalloprotease